MQGVQKQIKSQFTVDVKISTKIANFLLQKETKYTGFSQCRFSIHLVSVKSSYSTYFIRPGIKGRDRRC